MKNLLKLILGCSLLGALLAPGVALAAKEARVTQVVREVKLVPSNAAARPAALNDQVREGSAVRTGDSSRSELTFPDVTITRLGANTIFSFNRGGHDVDLSGGSVLLRVPKNSGGGSIRTNVVSVAVTGTTLIMEALKGGRSKLYVLEGGARLSLVKYRGQSRNVGAGQLLDVPAGATTLPMPQNINLDQMMGHPLVANFPPLPSRDLIIAESRHPRPTSEPSDEPVYQGQPVGGNPYTGPAISIGLGGGLPFPGMGGGSHHSRDPGHSHDSRNPKGQTGGYGQGQQGPTTNPPPQQTNPSGPTQGGHVNRLPTTTLPSQKMIPGGSTQAGQVRRLPTPPPKKSPPPDNSGVR